MVRRMARTYSEYDHIPIHWLPEFRTQAEVLLRAWQLGYGVDRWSRPELYEFQYGVYKTMGPNRRVSMGVFDTPEEVVGMLKLLLATAEKDDRNGII